MEISNPGDNLDQRVNDFISRLKVLTKNLSQQRNDEEVSIDEIWSIVEELQKINYTKEHCSLLIKIHASSVDLWNLAVGMKTDGSGSSVMNAKLRHASCNLLCIANSVEPTESSYKNQLVMATKTGRAWLDCENADMAETSLELAEQCWECLSKKLNSQQACEEKQSLIQECECYIFKMYCYQAEVAMAQSNYENAKSCVMKSKSLLGRQPKESRCLALVCYNFGVDTFQRAQYEESVEWLRDSYELGKGEFPLTAEKQSRTLRLLSYVYLQWDAKQHWQTALNAVGLANMEHASSAGLYLKAKILLLSEHSPNDLQHAFLSLLHHQKTTVDFGLSIVQLATEYNKSELAVETSKQLSSIFANTPDFSKIQTHHLELLFKNNNDEEAKKFIEQCIEGHNTGHAIDPESKKQFHIKIWEKATSKFEQNNYLESLEWYNYSLSLFTPEERQSSNVGKLYRNICSCHLALKDLEKAKQAITEAENCDHGNPLNSYFEFKISLLTKNNQRAINAINKLSENKEKLENIDGLTIHDIICLAAQNALDDDNHEVAIPAIENIIKHSSDDRQVITALRCLIRLKMTFLTDKDMRNDINTMLFYLKTAYDKITQSDEITHEEKGAESTWFMKLAWNLSLKCEDLDQEMLELLGLNIMFAKLCMLGKAGVLKQKSSLLMAASCSLRIAKNSTEQHDKEKFFLLVLNYVKECRDIVENIKRNYSDVDFTRLDDVPVLLSLYEFDAKAHLNHDDVEHVLHNISKLTNVNANTFESIAALTMKLPTNTRNTQLLKNALKSAIKEHKKNSKDKFNYSNCRKSYRMLIDACLKHGSRGDVESKEEAWSYFKEIAPLIENTPKSSIQEFEVQWLMTKSWNVGVHLYSAGKHDVAEKWCAMAIQLLQQLSTLKHFYEKKMTDFYSEILAGIESGQTLMIIEE